MTKTALVTGGAGFIGSHLTDHLLHRGCRVIVMDDLSTGSPRNLEHLRRDQRLDLVIDSVLDGAAVERLVRRADHVYHLAAAVGVDLIVNEPAKVIETNIIGTDNLIKACAHWRRPLFIASSSEVYGKSHDLPFNEEGDLVLGPTSKPRWSYACSKAIDEFLAAAYYKHAKLPTVVARFFNTAGPRQTGRYGMVIPRFVSQALAGDPITVFGDGEQSRCFAHVQDIVPAVVRLLESPACYGLVFNLGSRELVTINELAMAVKDVTGSSSDIVHVSYDDAYEVGFEDMDSRVPDTERARSYIGFTARRGLRDILQDMVTWKSPTRDAKA